MRKQVRYTLIVIIAYFLLTVAMTWPTALHVADAIPGDGFDGWQNYWNLWWVKEALLKLGTNPFFTDYLYPPTGVSLLFHTLNIFNAWWTLPLQLNFGPAIAYNSVVFLSFTLAGYGGYLLSLYSLTKLKVPTRRGQSLRPAAFVGGLVFTMSPFHMAHLLGHMQVFSMIWPPFYILYLLRTLEPKRNTTDRDQWRNAAITCLFLVMATLVDWYHTLYLFIFTGLALIWTLGRRWQSRHAYSDLTGFENLSGRQPESRRQQSLLQPVWFVLAIGLGFALILSPLLLPMIRDAGNRPDLQTGLVQNVTLSADLLAFITPSEMHPVWGDWAKQIADNFSSTTSERLIFAGFIPLLLGIFAAVRGWSKPIVRFWIFITLIFFILALGPFLHIGGKIVAVGGWPIPLPYLLLYYTVPFIGLTRSLSRYDLMVMLGLGVLVAIGLFQIQLLLARTRKGRPASGLILPVVATILICFEFLPAPYPVSMIDTPTFYFDIGRETDDYTIAELPMNWDRPTPLLHQTVHGKKLLTAYTSRNNPLELAWRTPVLQHWRYLGPDIIDQPLEVIAPTIFYDFNLRYIVLDYWQMPPGSERESTELWVAAALPGVSPIYDDGRLKVYQSPPMQLPRPYLSLGQGWSERQGFDSGEVFRTFIAKADSLPELFLHHPPECSLELDITAAANAAQTLSLIDEDGLVDEFEVTEDFVAQTILLPRQTGNLVKLQISSDNPGSPVSVKRVSLDFQPDCTEQYTDF